mgnify:CR=1 FL=1
MWNKVQETVKFLQNKGMSATDADSETARTLPSMIKDIQERRKDLRESSENLISYFVINPENEIIRKSIKEDIDVEVFLEGFIPGIYVRDNALLRKENIDLFYEPATIYLYKKYYSYHKI